MPEDRLLEALSAVEKSYRARAATAEADDAPARAHELRMFANFADELLTRLAPSDVPDNHDRY